MELALQGKQVLVTGGSRGIGFATAKSFVSEGAHVAIAAQDPDRLARGAQLLAEMSGCDVPHMAVNFSDPDAAMRVADWHGEVDILVNCAGAIPSGDLHGIDDAKWRSSWDAKVFTYIRMMRSIYPRMKARGGGVMVNVMGLGGEHPQWTYVIGGAGNAALMAATRGIGGRSTDDNIRVLGVNPGPVATDRLIDLARARATREGRDPDDWQGGFSDFPFGRPATPEEVADVIVFLASYRAGYISGTVITIDGGLRHRHSTI
jgi:3-oxoacyl-[acyl-carrier protein] reductase